MQTSIKGINCDEVFYQCNKKCEKYYWTNSSNLIVLQGIPFCWKKIISPALLVEKKIIFISNVCVYCFCMCVRGGQRTVKDWLDSMHGQNYMGWWWWERFASVSPYTRAVIYVYARLLFRWHDKPNSPNHSLLREKKTKKNEKRRRIEEK